MLRKVLWFSIGLLVCYFWISTVMQACSDNATRKAMSSIDGDVGEDEDVIFQADEDSGDDGYIISDEDDTDEDSDEEYDEENAKENPMTMVKQEDLASVEEKEEDFVEKSPERKTVSRDIISETTYSSSENASFLVIAGSFSSEENANRMVNKLKNMGYNKAEKIVFDFSQYYSVVSGKHDSESDARSMSLELKNKNINAYVHKMRSKFYGD